MKKLMRNVKFLTLSSVIVLLLVCGGARPTQAQGLAEVPSGILTALSNLLSQAGVLVNISQSADASTNLSLRGDVDLAAAPHLIFAPNTAGSITVVSKSGVPTELRADSATNVTCGQKIIVDGQ